MGKGGDGWGWPETILTLVLVFVALSIVDEIWLGQFDLYTAVWRNLDKLFDGLGRILGSLIQ